MILKLDIYYNIETYKDSDLFEDYVNELTSY